MYRVQIGMRYLERYSEILSHDKSNAEHHLGDLVKRILLDYFIIAIIDETCVSHLPNCKEEEEGKIFAVHITARCISVPRPLSPCEVALMELVLEDRISCALLELVGRVDVEEISIGWPPRRAKRKLLL